MKTYSVIFSDGYWQLHDGTMMGNGDPYPLNEHKNRNILILFAIRRIKKEKCQLNIYNQYGKLENQTKFPIDKSDKM